MSWVTAPRRIAALGALLASVSLVLVRCTGPGAFTPPPEVQVLLERDADDVRVELDGAYVVANRDGQQLASGRRLSAGRIRAGGNGLDLNGVALDEPEVVLRPTDADRFAFRGKSYPGNLRIRRDDRGRLEVHNLLDIEEYLAGVLFSEMPSSFPDEALKAQAVAARTYARYRMSHGNPLLRATDADQVYGGAGPKHERARTLVAATRGLVLETGGETLPAYFMSTCGGATVDAVRVFPGSPTSGLAGVACDWCRESPKYRWSRTLALPELARRLGVSAISSITADRDRLGHTLAFEVTGSRGSKSFQGQEFRRAWNAGAASEAEKLPSSWLPTIDLSRSAVTVQGAGFGHGVGLCQYGAAGLAKSGKEWRAILDYYYHGAQLVRRW